MPRMLFNRFYLWAGLTVAVSLCTTALWAQGPSAVPGYQPSNSSSPDHATISATPANYSGACPVTITVQGSLDYKAVSDGASLRYLFQRNNGSTSAIGVMSLNPNAPSSLPVSDSFQVSQSTQGWDQLSASLYLQGREQPSTRGKMTGVQSNRAAFSVNCIRSASKLSYRSPTGLEPAPAPARPGGYTPFQPSNAHSCARPVLLKISDRILQASGRTSVLADPGDNMEILANTSLPAQVTFSDGSQQGQGVSSSLNPNKLNQTQRYMATSIIVVVPTIATGSTQPVAGWVEVSDACGTSNRMSIELKGAPEGPYRVQPESGNLSSPQRGFQQNRRAMALGGNTAPTWTGVVQGAPAYSSFLLNTGNGRVLSVVGGQARYVADGRPVSFVALRPGARVKVSGSLSYNRIMAREVDILPGETAAPGEAASPFYHAPMVQAPRSSSPLSAYGNNLKAVRTGAAHPVLSPLRLPMLRLASSSDFASLAANQSQIHARVSAVQHVFPTPVWHSGSSSYFSRQPYNRNAHNQFGGQSDPSSNPPGVNDLAPIVSMFASGNRLGDLAGGTNVPTKQIASATFFSDPDPNWSASSTGPGIIGSSMQRSTGTVSTTLASSNTGGVSPLTPTFFVPVNSTRVNLVVPCYYLMGYGGEIYDHAHFELKVEYEGTTPGVWQTLTTAALEWGNTGGYNAPGGIPDTIINPPDLEDGKGYAWTIPIVLPAVASTLRVDVYIALYQSGQFAYPNERVDPNQPNVGIPGSYDVNQVGSPFSNGTIIAGSRHKWLASAPFQVVLLPTQLLSADDMPYGIIYAPPGNQSKETLESIQSSGVGTSFSVGNQSSTQVANVQGTSFTLGVKASFAGVPMDTGVTLSSNSTQTSGLTSADNQTESLSLTTSWQSGWTIRAPSNPQLPANDALQGSQQPYWNDHIIVIPHPVYAVWNYASSAGQPGYSAAQLIAYDKRGEPISIRDLAIGAGGSGYSDGVLSLTPAECAALLALDPFYVAGWQGATPPAGRAVPASSDPTAVSGSTSWSFESKTLSQSTQSNSQSQGTSQGQGSGSSTTVGFNVAGSGASFQNSQSTVNTLTTTYTATQSNTTGSGIEVSGEVRDTGTLPSNIHVWLDTVFGGVMFQDPNEQRFETTARGFGRVAPPSAAQIEQIRNTANWEVVRH